MKKLWEGRFQGKTHKFIEEYTESISFDHRLYREDIEGSIAHCQMLMKQGIISEEEGKKIIDGLHQVMEDIKKNGIDIDPSYEDIHTYIENKLREKIGDLAGKLHTARSRNDQIVLDVKLYLRKEAKNLIDLMENLQYTIIKQAEKEINTILPGFTHLQHAQPVSLAFHLLAYYFMFERDIERIKDFVKRLNENPLGSCALAGTTLPIDRFYTSKLLGFKKPTENAMDTVSSRDFIIEILAILSIIMVNLSRFCEELVLWSSPEFDFVNLPDTVCTGSSIMPQKKNPDVAELTRGKTGRVIGDLVAVLVTLKGLPLSYNRDLQEDKEPLFDAIDTTKNAIKAISIALEGASFNRERMKEMCLVGFMEATDLADYLVKKGMPFREAHETVGKIVQYCIEKGKKLRDLEIGEYRRFSTLFGDDVYQYIDLEYMVDSRRSYGGTSRKLLKDQIEKIKKQKRWN